MTPILIVAWSGTLVCTIDTAGFVEPVAVAVSEQQAEWLAWSLGRAHAVAHRKMESLRMARVDISGIDGQST